MFGLLLNGTVAVVNSCTMNQAFFQCNIKWIVIGLNWTRPQLCSCHTLSPVCSLAGQDHCLAQDNIFKSFSLLTHAFGQIVFSLNSSVLTTLKKTLPLNCNDFLSPLHGLFGYIAVMVVGKDMPTFYKPINFCTPTHPNILLHSERRSHCERVQYNFCFTLSLKGNPGQKKILCSTILHPSPSVFMQGLGSATTLT